MFLNAVVEGGRGVLTIVGGYGMGKTHVLKYLKYTAEQRGYRGVYVASPGRSFMDFYLSVLENLFDVVVNSPEDVKNTVFKHALELYRKVEGELGVYVKSWLLGFSIPASIRYKLGLIGNISEQLATKFLSESLNVAARKLSAVLVLLDEVETLLMLPRNARATYAELLRELVDNLPPSVGLALSMTPACWDELSSLNPALTRRLSGGLLYLKPLRREHAREFVALYFSELSNLIGDDALDFIHEVSNGVHGELLKYTSIVIEEALARGLRHVGAEDAKNILSEYL